MTATQPLLSPPARAHAQSLLAWLAAEPGLPDALVRRAQALAEQLAALGADESLRQAAILFPLAEAQRIESAAIAASCGEQTARLVRGLLDMGQFGVPAHWQPESGLPPAQSEALRRMLVSIVADVRLVLVRLADQLWKMTAAKDASVEERRRLAYETREIYAPLANRLGIWHLKWQLEDMAFRYLEPIAYKQIADKLSERRQEREHTIDELVRTLDKALRAEDIQAEVQGRAKHIFSIWRKMQQKELQFERVIDVRAVRVLVGSVADCYAALGIVHSRWPYLRGEFDDYIASPKENGYQSLHTAITGPGDMPVEIQIRTREMHSAAELGIAAHWRYKEGGRADSALDNKVRWLRRLLEPETEEETGLDFIERVKSELFEDRIYVLSPRGDVVPLPQGATPLDFAYAVHTEIGHHCRGARVNDRMVPLTYQLRNGEQVEILTARHVQPSRDWLIPQFGYLGSGRSRAKVRAWFRRQAQDVNRREGRSAIERELQRLDLKDYAVQRLADAMDYVDIDALSLAVGAGDITTAAVTHALAKDTKPESVPAKPRTARVAAGPERAAGLSVGGIDDVLSHFARCCHPVPPEAIAGFITLGRGVSIHRSDCTNLHMLRQRQPDRVVTVDWGQAQAEDYTVALTVHAEDRQGLLRDLSAAVADDNASILAANTQSHRSELRADLELTIAVRNAEQLARIIERLRRVPSVLDVRRS